MASPPAFTFTAPPPTPIDGIVRTERFVPANPDKNITAHTAYTICYTRTVRLAPLFLRVANVKNPHAGHLHKRRREDHGSRPVVGAHGRASAQVGGE